MLWEWIKCAVDTQSEQMLLENSTDRLALSRVTTDFQLVKKHSTCKYSILYKSNYNKIRYGCMEKEGKWEGEEGRGMREGEERERKKGWGWGKRDREKGREG